MVMVLNIGNVDRVCDILHRDESLMRVKDRKEGATPLMLAAFKGHKAVSEYHVHACH